MAAIRETETTTAERYHRAFGLKLTHPNLHVIGWEESRTDVHGIVSSLITNVDPVTDVTLPRVMTNLSCNCGVTTDLHDTVEDAFAELVKHVASDDDCPDYHSGCEDCFCCPDGCASGNCPTDSVGASACPCTCD